MNLLYTSPWVNRIVAEVHPHGMSSYVLYVDAHQCNEGNTLAGTEFFEMHETLSERRGGGGRLGR